MTLSIIKYNNYTFNDKSKFHFDETYVYDESGRIIKGTLFRLRVETIICNEDVSPGQTDYSSSDFSCGNTMHAARQKLSQPGENLVIDHEGFGPRLDINFRYPVIRDTEWGPRPKMLSWEPIGHTASVEVIWECEFTIPICNGETSSPSFQGLSALSYGISYSFDKRGFTTRRISGRVEIAMSGTVNGKLWDTVDSYRDKIIINKPKNFQREVSWDVSSDKRTANFTIVDTEHQSPNAWPPGVVEIDAQHRVSWSRSSIARINCMISATIEMAPDQFKARAWLIFRDIVLTRLQYAAATYQATSNYDLGPPVAFINSIDIVENIYRNSVSFQLNYYFLNQANLNRIFLLTGLFQPTSFLNGPAPSWDTWDDSIKHLQPFQGTGKDGGVSNLRFDPSSEAPINFCNQLPASAQQFTTRTVQPAIIYAGTGTTFVNETPPPRTSYIVFSAKVSYKNKNKVRVSLQVGKQDVNRQNFDPALPEINGTTVGASNGKIKRFVENNAGDHLITYMGYAERVGYPVPEPGVMKIGDVDLRPHGDLEFRQVFLGMFFGQPKYAASWKQDYWIDKVPNNLGQKFPNAADDGLNDAFAENPPPK